MYTANYIHVVQLLVLPAIPFAKRKGLVAYNSEVCTRQFISPNQIASNIKCCITPLKKITPLKDWFKCDDVAFATKPFLFVKGMAGARIDSSSVVEYSYQWTSLCMQTNVHCRIYNYRSMLWWGKVIHDWSTRFTSYYSIQDYHS